MMTMKIVYLSEKQAQHLKIRAQRERKKETDILSELVEQGIRAEAPRESAGEALLRLAAIHAKGPKDLSTKIDDYLYGENS